VNPEPDVAAVVPGMEIHRIPELTAEALKGIEGERAEAVVAMMPDDEMNYRACELAYEHWGCRNLVARLHEAAEERRFRELGVLAVHPGTALPRLLDHCVRSPAAAALALGLEEGQDIIDVEVTDPRMVGLALRSVHLPPDLLVVSLRRRGHLIITHGYTTLEKGDILTIVGSPESLEQAALMFESAPLRLRAAPPDISPDTESLEEENG